MVIHMQQKKENDNIMNYDTVRLDDENNAIIIIDQTKLPGSIELIALKTAEEICTDGDAVMSDRMKEEIGKIIPLSRICLNETV